MLPWLRSFKEFAPRCSADPDVAEGDRYRMRIAGITIVVAAAVALARAAAGQVATDVPAPVAGAKPVAVERIRVHGAAFEGNLEGNAVERDVLVFLPPSYAKEKSRRYPVVYAVTAISWRRAVEREIPRPKTIEGAFAQGART